MATSYLQFKKLPIHFSDIGLEQNPATSDYFCTPKGAKLIGWAGVDGIHYCFIKDFGEMVFAVSPCNLPGDYVHPLAKNFEDFLRLMLACNGLDAVEQVHAWGKDMFEGYLMENPVTEEQKEAFRVIRDKLGIEPMEQPFEYIKSVQAAFDYSKLRFKKEYKEYVSDDTTEVRLNGVSDETKEEEKSAPWRVYYAQGYHHHGGEEKPGVEIPINQQFTWYDKVWHVPAVYSCGKGLVVEFCVEIEPEEIKKFLEKVEKYGYREDKWSDEVREEMHRTNPTEIDFFAEVTVNGKKLKRQNSCGFGWMPESIRPEAGGWAENPEIEHLLEHYQLDRKKGWIFRRSSFAWATLKKPAIKTLQLSLKANKISVVAKRFQTPSPGENIRFTRPATGEEYTLTVLETEEQQMDKKQLEQLHQEELEFPTHYKAMTYTLSPELPGNEFMVQDCVQSERPRKKQGSFEEKNGIVAASVAIIGGADGPTSLFLVSGGAKIKPHGACSALHFEPVKEVEWKAMFWEKPCEDYVINLI